MKVKTVSAAAPLSPEDELMLRDGPQPPDYVQPSLAEHDRLREVWAIHGAAIRKSMPKGQRPWFVARDWFVKVCRGAPTTYAPR